MGDGTQRVFTVEPEPAPTPPAFAAPGAVAGLAVGIGLAIDALAIHHPPGWGLMLGLWIAVATAAAASALSGAPTPPGVVRVALAGVVVIGFIGIRTSPVLLSLNIGAAVGVIAVLIQLQLPGEGGFGSWTLTRYGSHPMAAVFEVVGGGRRFVSADLRAAVDEGRRRRLRSIAVGVAWGLPLLVVFGGLFASADMVFGDYADRLVDGLLFGSIFWRAALAVVIGLAVAGLWRSSRVRVTPPPPEPVARERDVVSVITVLALLVLLFLFFLFTQVIGHSPELLRNRDYSANAREGFFQLITVAFLVLTVLLLCDWLIRREDRRRSVGFDRLAVVLIVLTGVVMVSAANRMRLYVAEFGLTELRFYSSIFMLWLAFVLAWFMATVLRNRHARFALGLVASGLVFIIGLNVANPDALIVRVNWDRYQRGAEFAADYNAGLSVDSLPTLIAIRQSEPVHRWCFIEQRLARSAGELDDYWGEHGVLADSWSALQARSLLRRLDLGRAADASCGQGAAPGR